MLYPMYSPEYQDFVHRTGFKPWLFSSQSYSVDEKKYKLEEKLERMDPSDKPMAILILLAHASVPAEITNKIYKEHIKNKEELIKYMPYINTQDLATILSSKLNKTIKDAMWEYILLLNRKQQSSIINEYVSTQFSSKEEHWFDSKYHPPEQLQLHIWKNILRYAKLNTEKINDIDHQTLRDLYEYMKTHMSFSTYVTKCTSLQKLRDALVFQLCANPLSSDETLDTFWNGLNKKFDYLKNNKIIIELTGLELDENLKSSIEHLLPKKVKISPEINGITY